VKKNILVISNGRGEDSIAITILEQLKKVCLEEDLAFDKTSIIALPLVDDGSAYKKNGYLTAATWNTMPSKGFGVASLKNIFQDIRHGYIDIIRTQKRVITKEAQHTDLIVTVGDISPLFMACLFGNRKPIVHIGTAISAYIRQYSLLEIWLFKKYVRCVICRDEYTAEKLKTYGVNAAYFGNPMMDDPLLKRNNLDLGIEKKKRHIVLIPSSREDAYDNTVRMLQLIKQFGRRPSYSFVISLAPNLRLDILAKAILPIGWTMKDYSVKHKPLVAELEADEANLVQVVRGNFRDCLNGATAVFGMTGTGNEQIVGLGIPLVLLKGKSEAASWKRMVHYKKLLGDAVYIAWGKDQCIVEDITGLVDNNTLLQKMGEAGKQRMGEAGGAYYIARKLFYYWFHG